ncbi:MAG TPA: hypothetical protein VGI35_08835 [Steroidobacteraceae bacterium]|jgi:hypothetical protein
MMNRFVVLMTALSISTTVAAQVGTTVKEGAKATAEKAEQYGDTAKSVVASGPNKSLDKEKARIHEAKAHHHAASAKSAAKRIPK